MFARPSVKLLGEPRLVENERCFGTRIIPVHFARKEVRLNQCDTCFETERCYRGALYRLTLLEAKRTVINDSKV